MSKLRIALITVLLCVAVAPCFAQSVILDLPRQSQHAVLMQRVGITDITVNYHRPLVAGRKIWGGIVPYGDVWRAGANENTTLTITDPVTIEGKTLAAGTYGVHMIPNQDQWTVIFSKVSSAWGSFTYKESEDALRVTVKPQDAGFHEALTYDFTQIKPDSTVLTMQWEKVAVPVNIAVNVNEIVEASMRKQLRGLGQYTWEGWDEAATYLADNKVDLDEALKYSDESIQQEKRFDNLMTKSKILDEMGKTQEATTARNEALALGNAGQLYGYARQLQREHKQDEAFAVYKQVAAKYPNDWISHAGLARVYTGSGDYDAAVKEMKLCLAGAPEQSKPQVEGLVKRLEAKQNINQ